MNRILKSISFLILGGVLVLEGCVDMNEKKVALVYHHTKAYSADPLEYDLSAHHIIFRSVFSSLVTKYRLGEYVGILAESWRSSNDDKNWELKVRQNLKFENGDLITPEVIVLSLQRAAFVMKKKNSKSGLLENLVGFNDIESPKSKIEGISVVGKDKIMFRFTTSVPKFLESISFGLYAIAHPSNYDEHNGKWKDPKKIISSGPYKVVSWTTDLIELSLREDFLPKIGHPTKFSTIKITSNKSQMMNADIIPDKSFNDYEKYKLKFHGTVKSGIAFIRCPSWNDKDSICHNKESRKILRHKFYIEAEKNKLITTKSFFPLAIHNVREMQSKEVSEAITGGKLRFVFTNKSGSKLGLKVRDSLKGICKQANIKYEEVGDVQFQDIFKSLGTGKKYEFDLMLFASGILVEDPDSDIRFMFQSKEGIRLPDADGRIAKELEKKDLDIQKINELLWDQSIIWPITHFSFGLWVKEHIDTSILNTALPPVDFFWVGVK